MTIVSKLISEDNVQVNDNNIIPPPSANHIPQTKSNQTKPNQTAQVNNHNNNIIIIVLI